MKTSKNRKQKTVGVRWEKLTRKQIILICSILVLIVAAAGGIWLWRLGESQTDSSGGSGTENQAASDQTEGSGNSDGEGDSEADGSEGTDDIAGKNGQKGTQGNGMDRSGGDSGIVSQEGVHGISLPYSITGSSLVVRGIASYDGIYLEDGRDSEISGVTAIVLQNTGDTAVEYASVSISRDGTVLQFDASAIPTGGTVVVQEKNRTLFQEGSYTDCTATVAEISGFEMSEDQVKVEESGNQSLTVTNLTDQTIPAVRIFYKFYIEEEDAYVGGITYTAKITDLEAGGMQTVTPSHYMDGSSRVMMVRTYDTAE